MSPTHQEAAERHWKCKLTMRSLCFTSTFIGLGLTFVSYNDAPQGIIELLGPLAASLFWNTANITTRLCVKLPMHPIANVVMDLLVVLGFIVGLGFSFTGALTFLAIAQATYAENSQELCGGSYNGHLFNDEYDCRSFFQHISSLNLAASAFGTCSLVLHLVLFIWACVDTKRRRNQSKEKKQGQGHSGGKPRAGQTPANGHFEMV